MKKLIVLAAAACALGLVPAAFGADIRVPALELYTLFGRSRDGVLGLMSRGLMDLRVEGGAKTGGRIVLGFSSDALEEVAQSGEPLVSFQAAGIELREIFGLPVDLGFFTGENDTFGSKEVFAESFDAEPSASRYPGWLHFPSAAFQYEGIHTLQGTGISADLKMKNTLLSLYLYQDGRFDADPDPDVLGAFEYGHWAADLRWAAHFGKVYLEAFLGSTSGADTSFGYYRGGIQFYAGNEAVEFLLQAGIPRWAPPELLDIDQLYLLVEPRVRLGALSVIPTFFWRPAYYLMQPSGEQALDINLDLYLSRPAVWPLAGGAESTFVYQLEEGGAAVTADKFRMKLATYVQFFTPGVVWEIRLNANVLPFQADNLLEALVAVKAEF